MIEVDTAPVVRKKSRLDELNFFILVSLYYKESGAYKLRLNLVRVYSMGLDGESFGCDIIGFLDPLLQEFTVAVKVFFET